MATRKEQFLAMAEKAEKSAQKAVNDGLRQEWLTIAQSYRKLADKTRD